MLYWATTQFMRQRRAHLLVCWLAAFAYVANVLVAAGGAVRCEDPQGHAAIEIGCDHGHCGTGRAADGHRHADDRACWCDQCPCEDTPLGMDVAPLLRDDDARASTPDSVTFGFVQRSEMETRTANRVLLADRPPPAFDRSLRQFRTVVLIV
jgi:hypothetical protein